MDDDRDMSESQWEHWRARSGWKPPADAPRRPTNSAFFFLKVLIADLFIMVIAYLAAIGIGLQTWAEPRQVAQNLAGKQEGQVLTGAAIACGLLALVGLSAWRARALVAVAIQVVATAVVAVIAVWMAASYHHIAQAHPMY